MSDPALPAPAASRTVTRVLAAALGAAFFAWLAGWRLVSPLEYQWAMKFDWRIHFLGWHIFRGEPWGWPPGVLSGYYHAPDGTSIGYTDSLPIVAFLLKPFSSVLPMPMQYLGLWITGCFAAQGWWGVRLAALFTRSAVVQLLAALLLILTPTLLNRAAHPALCAQWLLLWAIWLYLTWRPGEPVPIGSMAALGAVSGLVHPYLAVMVVALLSALALRVTIEARGARRSMAWLGVVTGSVLVVIGWWASGMFVVPGTAMARPGLGRFSMNVLAVVTPSGWSAFLPAVPTAADGQAFEGFQYLGLGVLLTITIGAVLGGLSASRRTLVSVGPLLAVCAALALYALSPRVTIADNVIADYSSPALDRLAVFGVTGRFFWPAGYALIVLAMGGICRRLTPRAASILLAAAVAVQLTDLRPALRERLALTRHEDFHAWPSEPRSPVWAAALPHYDHIVLVHPLQCGPAPVTFELPAYLAGLYGLSVNVGEVARANEPDRARYCAELDRAVTRGEVDDRSVYLVHPANEARLRANAPALRCGTVEGIRVCVTDRSYQAWRDAAPFE